MSKARDIASAAPAPAGVTSTELGYIDGVTSAVQTQIDTKQAVVSGVNDTEIGYLDGVTSAIQTQLNAKAPSSTAVTLTGTETLTNKTISSGVLSGTLTAGGSVGTAGQVLSSTGTGVQYVTPSSGSWTLITQQNPSNANSVNFTSIPQTYKHIMLEWVGAYQTSAVQSYNVRINNDSGSNYSMNAFLINGGTVTPQIQESGTDISASNFAGSNLSLFGYDVRDTDYGKASKGKLIIFNYTDTARYKHSEWQAYYNITSEGSRNHQGQGVWKSLSAITSIDIVRVAGGNASLSTNTYGYIRLWGMS
jgi:hypothetical protein